MKAITTQKAEAIQAKLQELHDMVNEAGGGMMCNIGFQIEGREKPTNLRSGIFSGDILNAILDGADDRIETEYLVFNANSLAAATGSDVAIMMTSESQETPVTSLVIDGQLARFQSVVNEIQRRNGELPGDVQEVVDQLREVEFDSAEFKELREKASTLAIFHLHQTRTLSSIKH